MRHSCGDPYPVISDTDDRGGLKSSLRHYCIPQQVLSASSRRWPMTTTSVIPCPVADYALRSLGLDSISHHFMWCKILTQPTPIPNPPPPNPIHRSNNHQFTATSQHIPNTTHCRLQSHCRVILQSCHTIIMPSHDSHSVQNFQRFQMQHQAPAAHHRSSRQAPHKTAAPFCPG